MTQKLIRFAFYAKVLARTLKANDDTHSSCPQTHLNFRRHIKYSIEFFSFPPFLSLLGLSPLPLSIPLSKCGSIKQNCLSDSSLLLGERRENSHGEMERLSFSPAFSLGFYISGSPKGSKRSLRISATRKNGMTTCHSGSVRSACT